MIDMSVLINGMKMPDNCESCAFESGFGFCLAKSDNFCGYTNYHKRPEWCPLVELPEKHGRLFDEAEVKRVLHDLPDGEYKWGALALLVWAVEKRWCVEAEGE